MQNDQFNIYQSLSKPIDEKDESENEESSHISSHTISVKE